MNTQVYITGDTHRREAHSFTDGGLVQCTWKERGGAGAGKCVHTHTHTHTHTFFYRCNRYFTVPFSVSAHSSFLTKHRKTTHSYLMLPLSIRCVWIVPPWLLPHTWTTHCTLFTMPSTTWNSTKSNTVYVVPATMCPTCDNFFLGFHGNEDPPYSCWVWKPGRLQPPK
jgi:hypothetical protein